MHLLFYFYDVLTQQYVLSIMYFILTEQLNMLKGWIPWGGCINITCSGMTTLMINLSCFVTQILFDFSTFADLLNFFLDFDPIAKLLVSKVCGGRLLFLSYIDFEEMLLTRISKQ